MRGAILDFLINAAAVAIITSGLLPGIRITGEYVPTVAAVAILFALVNTIIKPILRLLTCPLIFLTLGLIIFVIDGAMLALTAALSDWTATVTHGRLVIDNLLWAIIGALIMGIVTAVLGWLLPRQTVQRVEVVHVTRTIPSHRANADQQFDALLGGDDAPSRPPRRSPTDGDPFDFYDPDTGKPKR